LSSPDNARGLQLTPNVEPWRAPLRLAIGRAHSGISFTILDGLMGWLPMSSLGRMGVRRAATVRCLAPLHVGTEDEFEAMPDPVPPMPADAGHAIALPSRDTAQALLGRALHPAQRPLFGADGPS
jgi:hypothetical protein